jgi:succinate dehydrogenase iron-sulfur subunit
VVAVVLILRVFRWSPEAGERVDAFRVEAGPGTTVLDALVRLRESEAPDLAFRYACRVGMCGSCAVVVDGRERWACRTRLAAVARAGATVSVRPLYHFPVIRDLAVDMAPFVDRMRAIHAWHTPAEPDRPAAPRDRAAVDAAIECIGCGACVSACTMVRWDPRFPGPAALNRAFTLAADGRDAGAAARWAALLGEDGLVRCHGQGQCTAVCPMELSPTDSILRLRRKAARALFLRT